ncbi:MAG: triose-phosphate isomerase, partial [Clostridia bacterium]|nr:triose-phosphate isomerase [Clostridia bacterium]
GIQNQVVFDQIAGSLFDLSAEDFSKIVLAYEPVWAIGTGETATADQADEVNHAIREVLGELYCPKCAAGVTIQYGGSMNAANAAELLAKVDVDGGLIGGASLKAADFSVIVKAASI